MIKIVRTRTLAALHAEICQQMERADAAVAEAFAARDETAEFQDRATLAEAQTRSAEAARATAETAYKALLDDTVAGLSRLKIAASDPHTGRGVQAELALVVVRRQIATAKASGDPDLISGFQILDALLGEDLTPGDETPAARTEDRNADCPPERCPWPYYPGGPVPCEAAGRCLKPPTEQKAAEALRSLDPESEAE